MQEEYEEEVEVEEAHNADVASIPVDNDAGVVSLNVAVDVLTLWKTDGYSRQ